MKGQIVLVVLLVTSAVMMMGLSLSKGSIKEIQIDTNEETLKQTFNVAESGLDNFLINNNDSTYKFSEDSSFEAEVEVENLEVTGMSNRKAAFYEPQFLKLNGYSENLKIELEENFEGAVKVDVFYVDGKVERYGYNFNNGNCEKDPCINGFEYKEGEITINIGSEPKSDFLVVTPLFFSTTVKFSGGSFGDQGTKIVSTGTSLDGVESKVSVDEVFELPYFMLEGLVVEGNIGS
jgi:hypothetical protein